MKLHYAVKWLEIGTRRAFVSEKYREQLREAIEILKNPYRPQKPETRLQACADLKTAWRNFKRDLKRTVKK